MPKYDPIIIEKKWNEEWYKHNIYEATDFDKRPKKYILAELPYPSGKALHAGHMMRFTVPDVYSRYLRMKGYNVMFPIGWDAFGLPAENYAIKTGVHPAKLIEDTIEKYKESLRRIGYGIDWEREINTTDPAYYKWTQWIFLKFFKAGLADFVEMPIWWCDTLKIVLSDEEVITDKNGNKISERGEHPVEKKNIKQWVLKITEYADKLIEGLETVEFPESIKNAQKNWIGRKEGINITYEVDGLKNTTITCFTTRPDTNFGATFLVVSPEHRFIRDIVEGTINTDQTARKKINDYAEKAIHKSDLERIAEGRNKTGVFTGFYAINKLNNNKMPIWVSDFVLSGFGTGAVIGVPGHDRRDFEFANTFGLEVLRVISVDGNTAPIQTIEDVQEEEGILINSNFLNGLPVSEAIGKMMDYLEEKGWGKRTKVYSLRDWVFSRQRYWGEPIPLIHTKNGKILPICDPDNNTEVDENLPLELPDVPDYNPTSDGSSPLEKNTDWVKITDNHGNEAKRETNTMPNWAGSCWYYIRYIDPKNDKAFAEEAKLKYWLPVDKYFGGAEHTTLHLLYSRFWHRFLYDQGLLPTKEPYAWRMNGGTLLGPDGKRMSKSRGNVVEPIGIIDKYGADALRMYIAFLGPYEDTYPWNPNGVKATSKLLKTIALLEDKVDGAAETSSETKVKVNKMIKNITEMCEGLKMNTCISEIMIFTNHLKKLDKINPEIWANFVKILAPFAPFISEELWQNIKGNPAYSKEESVHTQLWPEYDQKYAADIVTEIPVQVNGKVRAVISASAESTESEIRAIILSTDKLKAHLEGREIKKLIYIPGKIVNVIN